MALIVRHISSPKFVFENSVSESGVIKLGSKELRGIELPNTFLKNIVLNLTVLFFASIETFLYEVLKFCHFYYYYMGYNLILSGTLYK